MHTQCSPEELEFQGFGTRKVVADFSGGRITSDAGILLLREVEEGTGILRNFAECFVDYRTPELIEHSVSVLIAQRVYAIALGYEDINDHDELRRDALLAALVGKADPTGKDRVRERDRGCPLAGKSTLNRLELAPADTVSNHRYHKIACRPEAVDRFFVDAFLDAYPKARKTIILDFDATDDPLGLFADRTNSTMFSANQLRLWFSSVAYVLLSELRRVGLKGTELARARDERSVRFDASFHLSNHPHCNRAVSACMGFTRMSCFPSDPMPRNRRFGASGPHVVPFTGGAA